MKYTQSESRGWLNLATVLTACGFDALVLLGYLAVVDVVILSGGVPPFVQAVVALPLVVILPGYAVTAALFPRAVDRLRTSEEYAPFESAGEGALLPSERLALSFGTSLAVLPLLGIVHSVGNLGYSTATLLGTLEALVVLGLLVGVGRRFRVPRRERVSFSPGTWPTRARDAVTQQSRFHTGLTIGLVVVVLAATSGLSLALVAPADGESYTTMKILTEDESGELVTDGYPQELSAGESASLVLGVENHEDRQTSYTVVTELQSVRVDGNTTTVTGERELARTSQTVADGETWYERQTFAPDLTGEDLRLVFLLYRGEPADDPTRSNAYRYVHLSISVTDE